MVRVLLKPAQGGDVEQQTGGDGDVKPEPGHRDRSKDVAVGEREHAAASSLTQADEPEGAAIDLCRSLPAGAPVSEQLPTRLPFVDLPGGDPFVLAVVELTEHRRQPRIGEAGDLGRAQGTLKRAGKDGIEAQSAQPRAQRSRLGFALLGKWKIGDACVLAREAPFRLAVPSEVDV